MSSVCTFQKDKKILKVHLSRFAIEKQGLFYVTDLGSDIDIV